jgi:ubiquinone/menaquinone biosynthesis C-methylase UbiE
MDRHKLFGFTAVDQAPDPAYFIRFLDEAAAEPSFQAYKQRSFALLDVRAGRRILEVGCGVGDDARAMAACVRPGGEVVAVDGSRAMIAEARLRAEESNLPVRFEAGDAHRLDFPDDCFDGCRCDRTFMHLEDPRQALREMVRVVRRGGRVVVYEVDFETLVIDAPDRGLARRIVNAWCDGFRDGWLGRRLPAMFRATGLADVAVSPETLRLTYPLAAEMVGAPTVNRAVAAGAAMPSEAEGWLRWLAETAEAGGLFCTLTGFLAAGTKR